MKKPGFWPGLKFSNLMNFVEEIETILKLLIHIYLCECSKNENGRLMNPESVEFVT
jgi:hypothetical protein